MSVRLWTILGVLGCVAAGCGNGDDKTTARHEQWCCQDGNDVNGCHYLIPKEGEACNPAPEPALPCCSLLEAGTDISCLCRSQEYVAQLGFDTCEAYVRDLNPALEIVSCCPPP